MLLPGSDRVTGAGSGTRKNFLPADDPVIYKKDVVKHTVEATAGVHATATEVSTVPKCVMLPGSGLHPSGFRSASFWTAMLRTLIVWLLMGECSCPLQDGMELAQGGWTVQVKAVFSTVRAVPVQRQGFEVTGVMQEDASHAMADDLVETTLFLAANGAEQAGSSRPAWPQYGQERHRGCEAILSGFGPFLDGPARLVGDIALRDGCFKAKVLTQRLADHRSTAAGVNAAIHASPQKPLAALHVALLPGMQRQESPACICVRLESLELSDGAQSRAAARGCSISQLYFAPAEPQPLPRPQQQPQRSHSQPRQPPSMHR